MHHANFSRRQWLARAGTTLIGAVLTASNLAHAADATLGTRPVRVLVPFPAGGGGDIATRMVTDALAQQLKIPVVVENRPGGDGVIAVQELLRAAPDGHTILFGTPSALLYTPQLTPKKPPYDPLKDLTPITHFTSFTYFIYISNELPVKTITELVDYVHQHPGKVVYGTGDSTQLVAMAQLCDQAKLDMLHVHYKGTSQAFTDFMGGRIQVMVGGVDLEDQFKGKALPVVTLMPERSPLRPNVPTLGEVGLTPITIQPWTAFFAPAKTPRPIIEQLNKGFAATFQNPKLQDFFKSRGSVLKASTPEAVHEILVEQLPVFAKAIKTLNLHKE